MRTLVRLVLLSLLLAGVTTGAGAATYWQQGPVAPLGPELSPRADHAMAFDALRGRVVLFGGIVETVNPTFATDTWELSGSGWTSAPKPPAAMRPRAGQGMVFDSARGRVILFGGVDSMYLEYHNDTWEYDGTTWALGPAAPAALKPRAEHGMAFDSARSRTVLFGGYDGTAVLRDTWEFDGAGWSPGAAAPPALVTRTDFAMTYHATIGWTVLFGGDAAGTLLNDTWLYDGAAWTPGPVAPAALTGRIYHAMAYDALRGRAVLFGGANWSSLLNDTWEFDGVTWSPGPPAPPGLAPRLNHAMAFDAARGRTVLFGGTDDLYYIFRDDTWEYDGTAWVAGAGPPHALIPRRDAAMAFDAFRGRTVLFGGRPTGAFGYYYRNDTWEYDGVTWTEGAWAPPTLIRRSEHAVAYDTVRGRVVLFGGYGDGGPLDDTWEYDGTAWLPGPGPPAGLTARYGHAMAFDTTRGRTVLFGGQGWSGPLNDTWEYDGTTWTPGAAAPPALSPRAGHAMVFDSTRGRSVIFGGYDYAQAFDETWEFDGSAWLPGPAAPPALTPRGEHAMAFDAARSVVVLFGGTYSSNETWEYDGMAWVQAVVTSTSPSARSDCSLAYDSIRGRSVLFGGGFLLGNLNDTWEYAGCPSITLVPATLPAATFGIPYAQLLTATGGTAPYSFVVATGALPPGLTLSTGGALSGTPRDTGLYIFSVTATDSYGCQGSRGYSLMVGCPTIVVSPAALPPGSGGVAYSQILTAIGGQAPYAFSVTGGSLPPGLVLYSSGLLSGTPSGAGVFTFTVTAVDGNGCPGTRTYTLAIACGGVIVLPATLPPGATGQAYVQLLTATGGTAPYSFVVSAGALPPGLGLSTAGLLDGTPTAGGSFSFTVLGTDGVGCSGTQSYLLLIREAANQVVGAGLGPPNPNRIRVFTGRGSAAPVDFLAYGAGAWGVTVASGDLDGGAVAEILAGPGPGDVLGPQVRAFTRIGASIGKVNYFAYATLRFGVNTAAGDVDGDGFEEILTSPGPGDVFGPHIRGWNYDGAGVQAMAKISFYAYGTLRYGANVTAGRLDGDRFDELVTAPGPGVLFGPQVRGWDYDAAAVAPIAKVNFNALPAMQYGANVAAGDVDGDPFSEIAAAPGPGSSLTSRFLGFDYDGGIVAALPGFDVTPFSTFYGGRLGIGDLGGDGSGDLLVGAGRDPLADSTVLAFAYTGSTMAPTSAGFVPFSMGTYGVNVAGGLLGW